MTHGIVHAKWGGVAVRDFKRGKFNAEAVRRRYVTFWTCSMLLHLPGLQPKAGNSAKCSSVNPMNNVWTRDDQLTGLAARFFSLVPAESRGDWSKLRDI